MKKIISKILIFLLIITPIVVFADGEMYWAIDGAKCTSKSASCTLILSSSEIEGEHYESGTFTDTIGWSDYVDGITSVQIGK